jgi:putative Mg2+ transporter-C (MgtC) family protein
MTLLSQLEMLGQIAVAMALGALLGLERQLAHKAAGLRTHMLVAGAAAMLVGLVDALLHRFLLPAISPLVRADPVPVVTAVVMAVGFLGAGTIIRRPESEHVEGLTTAAAMLFAAAVGSAVGLRLFVVAIGATLLALVTLRGMMFLEERFLEANRPRPGPPSGGQKS